MFKNYRYLTIYFILIAASVCYATYDLIFPSQTISSDVSTAKVLNRSFGVNVHSVGELEASRSTVIASSIRGDLGKIIFLINDGVNVQPGDLLVKMDPTPFEEKIEELKVKIKDQQSAVNAIEQALLFEENQAEVELKTASYEIETAELELKKIAHGDGPLETYKLNSNLQKSQIAYEELNGYFQDLAALEEQGFLNPSERKQAEKKLQEEKDAFENAKMQYESYAQHVLPMLIKKAETTLRRANLRLEEVNKSSKYKIAKAQAHLQQTKQLLDDLNYQLKSSQKELALSEIRAPAPGMVVLREEYRSGQKRKPRVGDIVVKNQPILDLPDLNSMIVKTKVREIDLHKITVGKSSNIEVDAYPNVSFSGTINAIGVLALVDATKSSNEKYFEVKISLNNSDARLRPGMTARINTLSEEIKEHISIPIHAVFDIDKKTHVFLKEGNTFIAKSVSCGICNEQWVEIIDGLVEGQEVALSPITNGA